MRRSITGRFAHQVFCLAGFLLFAVAIPCACSHFSIKATQQESQPRVLPGRLAKNEVLLPNQWRLTPAGRQLALGDLPLNIALSPDGRYLAVNNNGWSDHQVIIVDCQTETIRCQLTIPKSWYGLTFSPDGKYLYVTGAADNLIYRYTFDDGLLSDQRTISVGKPRQAIFPSGMATNRSCTKLYVANNLGHSLSVVDLVHERLERTISLGHETYPYTCLVSPDDSRIYISLWGAGSVAVVDAAGLQVVGTIKTDSHPNDMVLNKSGTRLYVANANSNTVSVIDTERLKRIETITTSLYPDAPEGCTPNAVALSPDGTLLFVANADNNDVAVVTVSDSEPSQVRGFIPVGWYPTAVELAKDGSKLFVANGKGTTSFANPQGPSPLLPSRQYTQYIGGLLKGSLSIIAVPDESRLAHFTAQVYANCPYRKGSVVTAQPGGPNPIPRKVGEPSPIKYVVYIIKENRTYDQVFGDMAEGNGDPDLCLFSEWNTPNHHALAREFVLLDNFYVDAEVSADGHNWSTGAYAPDYIEKIWPQAYSDRGRTYDFEGHKKIAQPDAGYIWDLCQKARVTYRSYGEFIENGRTPQDPGRARVAALEGHFDPSFRSFDLEYKDVDRAAEFLRELREFVAQGTMPQFIIMRLPNDHTAGTRSGSPTPRAMVADNDLALGQVVEQLSKTPFWKEMAIFVIEDDAQNGCDHVDAHRTVALLVSPYARHGYVDSTLYSTTSMLRTIELILGLPPLSQYDAAATPMYNAVTMKPNYKPYAHRPISAVDLEAKNLKTAWGARESMEMNLETEDSANDIAFNEIIWKAIKGAESEMPPPVRSAFVRISGALPEHDMGAEQQ
jgi:YVTN family beta-propeller protein